MKQLLSQSSPTEQKYIHFKNRLGILNDAISQQKQERDSDIKEKVAIIKQMMETYSEANTGREKVLNSKIQGEENKLSELEELSEQALIKKCDLDEQIHAQSRNISELSERNIGEFGDKILKNLDINALKMIQQSQEGERKGEQQINSCISEFNMSKKMMENRLSTYGKAHRQQLQSFESKMNDEMEKMHKNLALYRNDDKEQELKLNIMIDELDSELSEVIDDQRREGVITYDSQVKLLEDCCCKIRQMIGE